MRCLVVALMAVLSTTDALVPLRRGLSLVSRRHLPTMMMRQTNPQKGPTESDRIIVESILSELKFPLGSSAEDDESELKVDSDAKPDGPTESDRIIVESILSELKFPLGSSAQDDESELKVDTNAKPDGPTESDRIIVESILSELKFPLGSSAQDDESEQTKSTPTEADRIVVESILSELKIERLGNAAQDDKSPHATVIFLRHGQSVWNEASLFTGWADVELTTLGKNEAAKGATAMWREGLEVDVAFTSLLTRAQQTLDIALTIMGAEDIPVNQDWRLNERMYGGLTGLNKKETTELHGAEQVKAWRRSYDTPPPPVETSSPYWPGNDNRYAHIPASEIPLSECLKDTVERCVPYWDGAIAAALRRGKNVLVAAHGNSIRGMVKVLDDIPDSDITDLEIPTGIPLVYYLDKDLKPIPGNPRAVAPLSGHFLVDPEELAKAQAAVAAQSAVDIGSPPAKSGWEELAGGVEVEDGLVQFACLGSGCLMIGSEEMQEAFTMFDSDGDGRVSKRELRDVVLMLDGGDGAATSEDADAVFDLVDRDKDGFINLEEFIQAVTAEKS